MLRCPRSDMTQLFSVITYVKGLRFTRGLSVYLLATSRNN